MGWVVHDLLRLRDPVGLMSRGPVPAWVNDALSRAPWVVVRRAPLEGAFIPIGVRGQSRGERFAAFTDSSSVVESVSPEELALTKAWQTAVRREALPAISALPLVHAILQTSALRWGPVGSVGFELASGLPVAHPTSDLDLVVRLSDFSIPPATTEKLLEINHRIEVRIDVLLETPEGAISLPEYVGNQPTLLLRSVQGPKLIPRNVSWGLNNGVPKPNSRIFPKPK
jgi:phosphoribosyl-dephospho-CoA transferase